jgi:hypothetical protein
MMMMMMMVMMMMMMMMQGHLRCRSKHSDPLEESLREISFCDGS